MGLIFKIARSDEEMKQIHRLNYRTFVEEIPQHPPSETEIRVDPFHHENTYLICLKDKEVIGMIAVRDKRPFSIDKKIGPVENHLPFQAKFLCEIRLLAVEAKNRNGRVFLGLSQLLAKFCIKKGYDAAVMSGTTRQTKLYKQLGFTSFHKPVGTEDAMYQPMYITKATFEKVVSARIGTTSYRFIPGPVTIADDVTSALVQPPISHRSKAFMDLFCSVKDQLLHLTKAAHCQILLGSGTLANEVISMQLKKEKNGLILINGEFGQRLKGHAIRAGLSFESYEVPWGQPFIEEEVASLIEKHNAQWIWMTHCETSTGLLNCPEMLRRASRGKDIKICLDSISTIGSIPIDLSTIYLASGVSGKAIGSYCGLSFVFHQKNPARDLTTPGYLDLGTYVENNSVPFTHSSNLISALHQALNHLMDHQQFNRISRQYHSIREFLEQKQLSILSDIHCSCPAILTLTLPKKISSSFIGEDMEMNGYQLHYESSYLIERNWIQISPLSNIGDKETAQMLIKLSELIAYYND